MSQRQQIYTGIACTLAFLLIIIGGCAVGPQYNAWKKDVNAKANLKAAESEKQIQFVEAQANLESEELNAEAEVARAKGAAEAISIEGGELTPNYIKYLWIRQLGASNQGMTKVYIPTEAGLPILEAGK